MKERQGLNSPVTSAYSPSLDQSLHRPRLCLVYLTSSMAESSPPHPTSNMLSLSLFLCLFLDQWCCAHWVSKVIYCNWQAKTPLLWMPAKCRIHWGMDQTKVWSQVWPKTGLPTASTPTCCVVQVELNLLPSMGHGGNILLKYRWGIFLEAKKKEKKLY